MNPRQAAYPTSRHRRLRKSSAIRGLSRENNLCAQDLIWPVFICEGDNLEVPIKSMPDVFRYSVDMIVEKAKFAADLGIRDSPRPDGLWVGGSTKSKPRWTHGLWI
mgnify:CR=1 FL=1